MPREVSSQSPTVSTPRADGGPAGPEVRLLTAAELLGGAVTDLLGAAEPGCERTAYPGLRASSFRSTLVVMPPGQRSPARTSDIEHVLVVLAGAFDFTIDGLGYHIERLDQLFVPVGVVWEYRNAARTESRYLAIVGP